MPHTHTERHFTGSEHVRDIVIGMSDGLTVPFALAAGLSAVVQPRLIVVAGLAEIAAGSIAMGLGGYLAARSDAEHYESERKREVREVEQIPDEEAREVSEVLETYGMTPDESAGVVNSLRTRPKQWVDFMMRFELGLEEPDPKRAVTSAATIAGAYVAGGVIPLSPYMLAAMRPVLTGPQAFVVSVLVTLVALGIFGYVKGRFTGTRAGRSALQTVVIGGLAAAAAYTLAKLIS